MGPVALFLVSQRGSWRTAHGARLLCFAGALHTLVLRSRFFLALPDFIPREPGTSYGFAGRKCTAVCRWRTDGDLYENLALELCQFFVYE